MRLQILSVLFICCLSFCTLAQELSETTDSEQIDERQTRKLDEFGRVGDCELGARLDALLYRLSMEPDSAGYVITYRGADALPAFQTDAYLQRQQRFLRNHFAFRRFDESRIIIIDGGFRKGDSVFHEIWLAPVGGVIPQPTETVEKSKTPTDKAFKVDEGFIENNEAAIITEEETEDVTEQFTEYTPETIEEETETTEIENSEEQTEEFDQELSDELPPFHWFSSYFGQSLKEAKDARGVIIFYTDDEEYDISKSREIVEDALKNLAQESEIDTSRVKIIFGGYREYSEIEYWIVPKGASEPKPTPHEKNKDGAQKSN